MPRKNTISAGDTRDLLVIGERLKFVRELADCSQEQVCEVIHVEQSTYSKWEKGKRVPNPLRVKEFCSRFRVSMDYIYNGRMGQTHPALAVRLLERPDLLREPKSSQSDRDTALASYRAAIARNSKDSS